MKILTLDGVLIFAANDVSIDQTSADLPIRFPVVVKPRTRAWLEHRSKALNLSIAGLSGLILDQCCAKTLGSDSHE